MGRGTRWVQRRTLCTHGAPRSPAHTPGTRKRRRGHVCAGVGARDRAARAWLSTDGELDSAGAAVALRRAAAARGVTVLPPAVELSGGGSSSSDHLPTARHRHVRRGGGRSEREHTLEQRARRCCCAARRVEAAARGAKAPHGGRASAAGR
eukprot:6259473-Prymnesium_polylepis.2